MNAEKAIAVLRIHTSSRGSSLATLNRELLRARFNKVVQQRTKLEPGLDVKRYQSMTDQRHVYESEAVDSDEFVSFRLQRSPTHVSVLTHEAFQYLIMIRRTKWVNGFLMETFEDPLDHDDDSEEDESELDDGEVPIAEEEEQKLHVGGQKPVKRGIKKPEVCRCII